MKKTIVITALFILISIGLDARPNSDVSFNFFYNSLRPYGEWIQLDNGLTVWRPLGMNDQWRPYSDGKWSWTADGWYWDSYEPFGWATYHYGRWYNDDYYGWIWTPDYDWAPAWVEWRYDDDYIGWAPLPPYASFEVNFGIHFSLGWHSHSRYWNFVTYNRFCDHRVHNYLLDERRVSRIFDNTRYRNNYYSNRDRIINGGIDRSFIERKAGYRIAEREITSIDNMRDYDRVRSERGDRIYSYRPSDREVINERSIDKYDIKQGDNRSTLDREKVRTQMSREWNRDQNITNDRNSEKERDVTVEHNSIRNNEGKVRNDVNRTRERNQVRNNSERERSNYPRISRETPREREPVYSQPERRERSQSMERRMEPRRESSSERSVLRSERRERTPERSSGGEKSSERKR